MNIRWQDKVTNQEVLDRADSSSMESLLLRAQLRWTGHISRMDDSRIPRQLLYGVLKEGSRRRGRPKLRYKDTLKSYLSWCSIQPHEFEATAANRQAWRSVILDASEAFERNWQQRLMTRRDNRHRAASAPVLTAAHRCDTCGRLCASKFGLQSHMRSHKS